MSATLLSQSGIFSAAVYERILQQLSAISHQASAFDCEETVYERGTSPSSPPGPASSRMQARWITGWTRTSCVCARCDATRRRIDTCRALPCSCTVADDDRSMLVLQKPESARLQPTVLCRTVLTTEFASTEQDPSRLISALGYRYAGSCEKVLEIDPIS